jgi:hypothetical protein
MLLPMNGDETLGGGPRHRPSCSAAPSISAHPRSRLTGDGSPTSRTNRDYSRSTCGRSQAPVASGRSRPAAACSPRGRERDGNCFTARASESMVTPYAMDRNAFHAEQPRPWPEARYTSRGLEGRRFDLHPDGNRLALAVLRVTEGRREAGSIDDHSQRLRRAAPKGHNHETMIPAAERRQGCATSAKAECVFGSKPRSREDTIVAIADPREDRES